MILGSEAYIKSPVLNTHNLAPIQINSINLEYTQLVKNLGIWLTPTLTWKSHVDHILKKVHSALGSLHFHRKSLSIPLKKQLILALVLPHFDYGSLVYFDLDKTRVNELQVAHNSCIRFIFGYIPFIPNMHISTHLTQKRLELGWLSLSGRRHLQLAHLSYKTIALQKPSYLSDRLKLRSHQQITSRSLRLPPRPFDFPSPRTEAWKTSFSISSRMLLNTLVVTLIHRSRVTEFKKWLYTIFLKQEIEQWRCRALRENLLSLNLLSNLPHPPLPLNESAFTFTNTFLNTTGYTLRLPFIDPRTYNLRSHL